MVPDTSFTFHTFGISKRAGTGMCTETFPTMANPSFTEVTYCTLQPGKLIKINLCHLTGCNHCLTNGNHQNCTHLPIYQLSVIASGFTRGKLLLFKPKLKWVLWKSNYFTKSYLNIQYLDKIQKKMKGETIYLPWYKPLK